MADFFNNVSNDLRVIRLFSRGQLQTLEKFSGLPFDLPRRPWPAMFIAGFK